MAMDEHREALFSRFPIARILDESLRSPGNPTPMFFMRQLEDQDLKGAWYALARLGKDLERQFNIRGEVAVVFTEWDDFQRRSFNVLATRLHAKIRDDQLKISGVERFTPDGQVVLLASPDRFAAKNLGSWNETSEGAMVVLIDAARIDPRFLLEELVVSLSETVGTRDLFLGKNPVAGDDFFGRGELLQDISAALQGGQNVALFGLRRSGKTSVLLELKRRLRSRGTVVIISDLEMVPDLSDFPQVISDDLNGALRILRDSDPGVWIGGERDRAEGEGSFTKLASRIKRVAERNPDYRFVFAIDEIESLVNLSTTEPEKVRAMLGSLRAPAQGVSNVTLLFAGVSNRVLSRSSFAGNISNPAFEFFDHHHLNAFQFEESKGLLEKLGAQMLLSWEPEAIEYAHAVSGGFPFFLRALASSCREHIRSSRVPGTVQQEITRESVQAVLTAWAVWAQVCWAEITSSLVSHFEYAGELLASSSDRELNEWVRSGPEAAEAAQALASLGLLESIGAEYRAASSLAAFRDFKMLAGDVSQADSRSSRFESQDSEDVRRAVREGESQTVEFKQTARVNLHTGAKDSNIELSVVKSVAAFLNSSGGTLFIGVSDAGEFLGVGADYAVTKNADRFAAWLSGDLLGARIDLQIVSANVLVETVRVVDQDIVRVRVRPSSTVAWVDNADLYIRNGNQTQKLHGRELQAHIARRVTLA